MKTGRIEQDKLVLGSSRYRVVVLPAVERIPLETMRKLDEFVRGGGIVIATRRLPEIVPGLKATDADQSELHQIAHRLFESSSANAQFIEDEKQSFARKLASLLPPYVSLRPAVPEIRIAHRFKSYAAISFVNTNADVA